MTYLVVFEPSANGYSAYVPDLPVCVAAADSYDETRQLIAEAIAFHIEALRESDMHVPPPASTAELIEVPV